jgi:hypothetical protein
LESRAVNTPASRRSLAILNVGEKSEPEQSDDGIGDACDKPDINRSFTSALPFVIVASPSRNATPVLPKWRPGGNPRRIDTKRGAAPAVYWRG